MKRLAQGLALVALTMFASAGAAQAAIIDFQTGGAGLGGTITTASGYWYGSGIPLNTVSVIGTPTADGNYDLSGTGDGTLLGSNCCAVLNFSTETGAFNVTGGVPSLGIADGTTLMSGTLTSSSVSGGGSGLIGFLGIGFDTKSPLLLTALGLDPATQFTFLGTSIALQSTGVNTYTAFSTDIGNQSIPEPGVLALFGLGLLGVGRRMARRRA